MARVRYAAEWDRMVRLADGRDAPAGTVVTYYLPDGTTLADVRQLNGAVFVGDQVVDGQGRAPLFLSPDPDPGELWRRTPDGRQVRVTRRASAYGGSSQTAVGARIYYVGADQPRTDGATDVVLNQVDYNRGLDVTSSPNGITVPDGADGLYDLVGEVWFRDGGVGSRVGLVVLNDDNVREFGQPATAATATNHRSQGTAHLLLVAGDVLSLATYTDGGAVDVSGVTEKDTGLSIARIGV